MLVEYARLVCDGDSSFPISADDEGISSPGPSGPGAAANFSVCGLSDQEAFSVHIDARTSEDLGLDVDDGGDHSLLILGVYDGVFLEWNHAHPELPVEHGDRIVGVNGTRGSAKVLLQKLRHDEFLILALEKPAEFLLRVERCTVAEKIGVDVARSVGTSLVVRRELDGLLNGGGGSKPALRGGDRITQVNDIFGDADAMLKELGREPCVNIRFSRWEPDWNIERHLV